MFPPTLDQILSPIEATPHTVEEVYLNGLVDGGDSGEPLGMVYVYHRNSEVISLQEAYKTRYGVRYYRATVWHSQFDQQSMSHKDRFLTVLLRGDAIVSVEK
jgi:hypothetical protein